MNNLLTIGDVVQHRWVCIKRWVEESQSVFPGVESLLIDAIDDRCEDGGTETGSGQSEPFTTGKEL